VEPEWVRSLAKSGTSLGTVLGPTKRTLLYYLLTKVRNGDRIVLKKLDTAVSTAPPLDEDDSPRICIDLSPLTDPNANTDNILKDILDIPRGKSSQVARMTGINSNNLEILKSTCNFLLRQYQYLILVYKFLYPVFIYI
jgi:hypothetical protein